MPQDIAEAVETGLHGDRRSLDTGTVNGEHFTVMAVAGLDAMMIKDADAGLKDRFGRAAYLWTGARNLKSSPVRATVTVEGRLFHQGNITCVLVGNVKDVFGGIEVFDGSRPDDGLLEIGIVTAKSLTQWARTVSRVVVGRGGSRGALAVRRHDERIEGAGDFRQTHRLRARRRSARGDKGAAHQGPTSVDHGVRSRAGPRR